MDLIPWVVKLFDLDMAILKVGVPRVPAKLQQAQCGVKCQTTSGKQSNFPVWRVEPRVENTTQLICIHT